MKTHCLFRWKNHLHHSSKLPIFTAFFSRTCFYGLRNSTLAVIPENTASKNNIGYNNTINHPIRSEISGYTVHPPIPTPFTTNVNI